MIPLALLTYDTPPSPGFGCGGDLGGGSLARVGRTGLGVQPVDDNRVRQIRVKWPYGYTAYLHDQGVGLGMRAVLADDAGQVVANQGDIVAFEGNMGPERTFYICPGTRVFRIVSPDDEGPRP